MNALQRYPDIHIVETFDIRDDAVRVAEVIAAPTQRYPDLDGWLFVARWPIFVRNALDSTDSTRTKVVAFDAIPASDLLRPGKEAIARGTEVSRMG